MISMYFTVVLLGCRHRARAGRPSLSGTGPPPALRHHRSLLVKEVPFFFPAPAPRELAERRLGGRSGDIMTRCILTFATSVISCLHAYGFSACCARDWVP